MDTREVLAAIANFWRGLSDSWLPAHRFTPRSHSSLAEFQVRQLSPHEQAIASEAQKMLNEFGVLYGTDIDGKSRDEIHQLVIECKRRLDEISGFFDAHPFMEWKDCERYRDNLDSIEIKYQPLYQAKSEGSTLVAVIDTETTGLSENDEPISVGVVLLEVNGESIEEIDSYYGLREPSVPINPEALRVHGLAMERLRGLSFDMRHLRKLLDSADLLVAHNAKFDRRMLARLIPSIVSAEWACSMYTLKFDWAKIASGRWSLDAICDALAISRPQPHNALSDCRALISVLKTRAGSTRRSSTRMERLIRNAWAPNP